MHVQCSHVILVSLFKGVQPNPITPLAIGLLIYASAKAACVLGKPHNI